MLEHAADDVLLLDYVPEYLLWPLYQPERHYLVEIPAQRVVQNCRIIRLVATHHERKQFRDYPVVVRVEEFVLDVVAVRAERLCGHEGQFEAPCG